MASSQPGGYDGLGEFVDFSQLEFDNSNATAAGSASTMSPTNSSNMSSPPTLKTESSGSSEVFSGPSHQYNLYKQQTPFVPGALHTAMSMAPPHNFFQDYLSQQTDLGDMFDFNTPLDPLDMEFQTSLLNSTINPNVISGQDADSLTSPLSSATPTSTTSNFVRPWPGMHQQAALARAQQQQRQQQQQQQRQQQLERQRAIVQAAKQVQKSRAPQTSDSIAQQSVQQIMNAIRSEPVAPAPVKISPTINFPKKQKTEEEMDPDEKFLASEEAKKLDSRERRQLRNKVSARAFRSRRKEYISWLENELSDKHNENALLKAKNRALEDENARLTALTRELLMAPQFQDYLNDLASNPAKLAQLAQQRAHPEQPAAPPQPQMPHDMNPHQRAAHFQEQFQQFQQHQACYAA